ncbi:hypothetical protein F7725_023316 [Dissostichus mawsoni]|uniref:Uncharacterized protein n=1 Tax=Dissostichus mawsoni TaxID=36200 RepID=A0A7J5Z2B6_DISMA|nr:hypothetical protein F7725_023316 [Dissostichus mawsoni]
MMWRTNFDRKSYQDVLQQHSRRVDDVCLRVVPGLNGPGREPPVLLLLSARIFIFEELLLLLSSSPLVFHVESWDWASPKCLRTARVSPPVEWQRRVGDDMESVKAIPLNRYQGTACVLLRGLYRERVDIRSVHEAKNSSAGQLQVPGTPERQMTMCCVSSLLAVIPAWRNGRRLGREIKIEA